MQIRLRIEGSKVCAHLRVEPRTHELLNLADIRCRCVVCFCLPSHHLCLEECLTKPGNSDEYEAPVCQHCKDEQNNLGDKKWGDVSKDVVGLSECAFPRDQEPERIRDFTIVKNRKRPGPGEIVRYLAIKVMPDLVCDAEPIMNAHRG